MAATAAIDAVTKRVHDSSTSLADQVANTAVTPAVVTSLITSVLGLVLVSLARHDFRSAPDRYSGRSARTTRTRTGAARIIAVPALIRAAVILIAFLIARGFA